MMAAVASSFAPCRAMARGSSSSTRSNGPSSRAFRNPGLNTRAIGRPDRGHRVVSSRASNEHDPPAAAEPLLVVVEVDGVLCDVHCDLHRLAFNEAFVALGMEGASWSEDRYLSLLRTGGGTAEGMVERYFHFYGYPTPELRDPTAHIPDEVGRAALSIGVPPSSTGSEGDRDADAASVAAQAAAIQAAASRDPLNRELLARRRTEWIDQVVAKKNEALASIVSEGRLKLRKGALDFLDECLLEDGAQVVFVGATASAPEEGVLDAVLRAIGPLRAAAVTQCAGHEQIEGCAFEAFENYRATNNIVRDVTANGTEVNNNDRDRRSSREEQMQPVGKPEGATDLDVQKQMQAMMKQRKGELLAEEVGGDLQRQSFNSDMVVDSGVFCTSTRSVISAEAMRGMLEAKGFQKERAIFVGASRTTCAEAGAAGVFNVLARTAHQADSQITDVACVVDGFGGGGGLTLRYIKHRMAAWDGTAATMDEI